MGYQLKKSYKSVDELETRDRALSVIYGRTDDALGGDLVPIRVDAAGNLIIGTQLNLETDNLDIGDIVIKGTTDVAQSASAEERLGLAIVGASPSIGLAGQYSLLTQDPRQNFLDNALETLSQDKLFATDNFTTVDGPAFVQARPVEGDLLVRQYKSKMIVLLNTGANSAQYSIMGSVDGVNFDITIANNALIASSQTVAVDEERVMTHIKITAHSTGAGLSTNLRTRAYAMGS